MKKQINKAFSLVELSIVILIVGVLVAAVGQGLDLLQDARLNAARTLTQSSRVNSIKNLIAWYEPTLEKSFDSADAVDQASVSKWYDTNPQTTAADRANLSITGDNRPKYVEKCINSLPCLDFDGTDDRMVSSSLSGANGGISIFAVVNLDDIASSDNKTYTILSTGATWTAGYAFNLKAIGTFTPQFHFQHTNANYPMWSGTKKGVNYLVEAINYTSTASLWVNKIAAGTSQGAAAPTFVSFGALNVGGESGGNYFNGKIAELIVFDRPLTNKEKISVEDYLDKKWQLF